MNNDIAKNVEKKEIEIVEIWTLIMRAFFQHPLFLLTVISVLIGFMSWEYSSGYFKILGIDNSYSHIDNLVFFFSKLIRFDIKQIIFSKVISIIFLAVTLVIGALVFVSIKYGKKIIVRFNNSCECFKKIVFTFGIVFVWGLFVVILGMANEGGSLLSVSFFMLMGVGVMVTLGLICFFSSTEEIFHIAKSLLIVFIFVFFANIAYELGDADARLLMNEKISDVDSICLSKKGEAKVERCGKLIHSNSSYYYIVFSEKKYPKSIKKGDYEVTIIPSVY